MTDPVGVLLMAYGTASGPEDVERYYTDIRGGRPPSPEHLRELRERYEAIGNRFPLLDITRHQASGVQRDLDRAEPGGYRVYLGMKHSPPFISQGVAEMRADGIRRAVGLVLAPHWSGMSVDTYVERVEKALAEGGSPGDVRFSHVRWWYEHPGFLDLLASRVRDALGRLDPDDVPRAVVAFTAHSLPTRTLDDGTRRCKLCTACPDGCRYVRQLADTARLVADRVGLEPAAVRTALQSAGRTPDPWWGPPVEEVIRGLPEEGRTAVVVCSAGFVADHLETLYDLDVEAAEVARQNNVRFERTAMPNADPSFVRMLAAVVRDHVAGEDGTRR